MYCSVMYCVLQRVMLGLVRHQINVTIIKILYFTRPSRPFLSVCVFFSFLFFFHFKQMWWATIIKVSPRETLHSGVVYRHAPDASVCHLSSLHSMLCNNFIHKKTTYCLGFYFLATSRSTGLAAKYYSFSAWHFDLSVDLFESWFKSFFFCYFLAESAELSQRQSVSATAAGRT